MHNTGTKRRLICCICKITDTLCTDFVTIWKSSVDSSKKPLISVINHLLKATSSESDILVTTEDTVCNQCYHDLLEYDDLIVRLLSLQNRFKKLLHSTSRTFEFAATNQIEVEQLRPKDGCIEIDSADEETELKSLESPKEVHKDGFIEIDSTDEESESKSLESPKEVDNLPKSKIKCDHCRKKFFNKDDLYEHIKCEHSKQDSFRCNVCRKCFQNDEYLELHMNVHEGKTERDCRYCPKQFSRSANVIRHMQKHWNKKKFQCEKCGLCFSDTSLLYNHRLLHEGEETPITCEVCQQSCKTRRTYKNHLLTHRDDRNRYPCEVCGKLFMHKYTLKVHRRTHGKMTHNRT